VMSSFTRSTQSLGFVLPPLWAVAPLCGAWEFILEDGDMYPNPWLRAFVITGRLCTSADWSECYLSYRECDNAVMLQGGVLSLEQETSEHSILKRFGQTGYVVRFCQFNLPPQERSAELQGTWGIISCPHGYPSIHIFGCLWECGAKRGILKYHCTDKCVLLGTAKVVLEEGGTILTCDNQKCVLRFERQSRSSCLTD